MPRCHGPLVRQRTLLPCLRTGQEDRNVRVSGMHDPKALSLPNFPEGFIAQEGGAVGGRNVVTRGRDSTATVH